MRLLRVAALVIIAAGLGLTSCGTSTAPLPAVAADVPRISAKELKRMVDAGERVIVVDTRSLQAYAASHIPGAVSMPIEETETRQGELDRDAKIVMYCT
jgi:predicted sulfurtransferase